jgi:hypothetical protein
MAMVREDLSSPASVISAAELETTFPATVEPSRRVIVACGLSAGLVAQEHSKRSATGSAEKNFSIINS